MKKRVVKGYLYYYIGSTGRAITSIEQYSKDDDDRFKIGNYFDSQEARDAESLIHNKGWLSWITKR